MKDIVIISTLKRFPESSSMNKYLEEMVCALGHYRGFMIGPLFELGILSMFQERF